MERLPMTERFIAGDADVDAANVELESAAFDRVVARLAGGESGLRRRLLVGSWVLSVGRNCG